MIKSPLNCNCSTTSHRFPQAAKVIAKLVNTAPLQQATCPWKEPEVFFWDVSKVAIEQLKTCFVFVICSYDKRSHLHGDFSRLSMARVRRVVLCVANSYHKAPIGWLALHTIAYPYLVMPTMTCKVKFSIY